MRIGGRSPDLRASVAPSRPGPVAVTWDVRGSYARSQWRVRAGFHRTSLSTDPLMWAGSIDHAAAPSGGGPPRRREDRPQGWIMRGRSCRRRGSRSSVRRSPWRRRRSRPSRPRVVPLTWVIAPAPELGSKPVTQPAGVVAATAAFSTVASVVVVAPGPASPSRPRASRRSRSPAPARSIPLRRWRIRSRPSTAGRSPGSAGRR